MTRHGKTLAALRALARGATPADLRAATGLSRAGMYRLLADLRELGLVVAHRPEGRGVDTGAPYQVLDWGVFDARRLRGPKAGREPHPAAGGSVCADAPQVVAGVAGEGVDGGGGQGVGAAGL